MSGSPGILCQDRLAPEVDDLLLMVIFHVLNYLLNHKEVNQQNIDAKHVGDDRNTEKIGDIERDEI